MKISFLLCPVLAATLSAGETLIPVVAWEAGGAGGNKWTTEIYMTNLTGTTMDVNLSEVLPLRIKASPHPCLPPQGPITLPPHRTKILFAGEVGRFLGCPEEFVGAFVFSHPEGFLVQTRMTNTKTFGTNATEAPLQGFSQEIPGVPVDQLPGREGRYILPSLAWSSNPCPGQPVFDVYLYFANPGELDATVTLFPREGENFRLRMPQEQELPFSVKVPAGKVVQLPLKPVPPPEGSPCTGVDFFDLYFETDAPIGVMASVVDRATNDARTVLVTAEGRLLP